MYTTEDDANKRDQRDKRKLCTMLSWGLIGLALVILLIVVLTRVSGSKQAVKRGGSSSGWKASGGNCGCMAGM